MQISSNKDHPFSRRFEGGEMIEGKDILLNNYTYKQIIDQMNILVNKYYSSNLMTLSLLHNKDLEILKAN
jgi:secreted Zn-dependent insulinase-like peptidase